MESGSGSRPGTEGQRTSSRRRRRAGETDDSVEKVKSFERTVKASYPPWKLLYEGPDTYYDCMGIMPDEIFFRYCQSFLSDDNCRNKFLHIFY